MKKLVLGIMVFLGSTISQATPIDIVDLEYVNSNYGRSISHTDPIGQTFTATANVIDFVDVWLRDQSTINSSHEVYIEIREDYFNGNLIGRSNTVELEDCFNFSRGAGCGSSGGYSAAIHFDFSSLDLVIDSTYIFEIVDVKGTLGVSYDRNGGFDGGSAYFNGRSTNYDLSFRTGHIEQVSEPSTIALLGFSLVIVTRRRNQLKKLNLV